MLKILQELKKTCKDLMGSSIQVYFIHVQVSLCMLAGASTMSKTERCGIKVEILFSAPQQYCRVSKYRRANYPACMCQG